LKQNTKNYKNYKNYTKKTSKSFILSGSSQSGFFEMNLGSKKKTGSLNWRRSRKAVFSLRAMSSPTWNLIK
jgi:hypothetical protein